MAEWLWVESAGTALEEAPNVGRMRFGDGYEEVAPAGLNPITQRWALTFSRVDNVEADSIMAFLRARSSAVAGLETFTWVPLWGTVAISVRCASWTRRHSDTVGQSDISAVFEQVHQP